VNPRLDDTIAAVSTPPGAGAISIVRMSGPEAVSIAAEFVHTRPPLTELAPRLATFCRIREDGRLLDEGLVTVFRAPHSYTGEDLVEIACHGNPFLVNRLLTLLLMRARAAEPGEFTQRAFLNGRLDLTRAEAVGDLLAARTRRTLDAAAEQLEGRLHGRIAALLARVTHCRIQLELEIDFAEQDTPVLDPHALVAEMDALAADLAALGATGDEGVILREGLRVALVGPPNVGKSSIFNAFLQTERAIVTPEPGTTRDWLEEAVALEGYLVRLFDTAGLRRAQDAAEQAGIERSGEIVRRAHRVLLVSDGGEAALPEGVDEARVIRVVNKADGLPPDVLARFVAEGWVPCCAIAPHGLDALKARLLDGLRVNDDDLRAGLLTNARQVAAALRAAESLDRARAAFAAGYGYEYVAFDLKEAGQALEEIIGRVTADDILNAIFANYCIGK